MGASGEPSPSASPVGAGPSSPRRVAPTSPVAVVWCRQVDNEAESPGYTTVPEEFPGRRETLDAIRLVGNLTVNVADTHDYWDPDPSQPLSYYPNLFLYPAFGGRYTCVGRMFLSTEDRPRLGMKTLVLDTAQLLATGDFGSTIVRWHASMGGPRREGSRPPPIPDPALYAAVGEGFLFHRGSTDPVLLVASDEWESTMQVVFDMVRALPASLVGLGAILAFPYFLPQPKTDLNEFTEQIPLSLAVMRVPRGEAVGDRHAKRISAWEDSPLTVRDLTDGVPAPSGRGKESVPLVVQFVRDHNDAKLAPIVQRVDFVELDRVRQQLGDPEKQSGKDRRKEMWRIGTAMESAALLLQRARGRHVPVNVETAKRAQEYIHARVPETGPEEPVEEAVVAPSAAAALELSAPGQHPPWLQRGPEPLVAAARSDRVEAVPVSVSDDPSLHRPDPPAAATPFETPPPVPSPFAPEAIDTASLRLELQKDLLRFIDERLVALRREEAERSAAALKERLDALVDARSQPRLDALEARIRAAAEEAARGQAETAQSVRSAFERRLAESGESQSNALSAVLEQLQQRIAEAERNVGRHASDQLAQAETRLRESVGSLLAAEVDRRVRQLVDPRVAESNQRALESAKQAVDAARVELRDQWTRSLAELADREAGARERVEAAITLALTQRLAEQDARRTKDLKDLDDRLRGIIDGRSREANERVQAGTADQQTKLKEAVAERIDAAERRWSALLDSRIEQIQDGQLHGMADLQVRLQSYFEQKLREEQGREREKYLELLARLKSEVETQLPRLLESPKVDAALRERLTRGLEPLRTESQRAIDQRIAQAEDRLKVDLEEGLHRIEIVEQQLGERGKEILRLEETIRSDLDELERRTAVISDRLVPVVRRTWQRIGELEKTGPGGDADLKLTQVRREFQRELHRVEGEVGRRTAEIRDRMETAIANQGKVWLTLIRQLSQLTEDRRVLEESRMAAASLVPRVNPMDPERSEEPEPFDDLDAFLPPTTKARGSGGPAAKDPSIGPSSGAADERPDRARPRRGLSR